MDDRRQINKGPNEPTISANILFLIGRGANIYIIYNRYRFQKAR